MIHQFPRPAHEVFTLPALVIDAARCRRRAQDRGELSLPHLSDMLAAHDCAMLAPALDSLCLFYEAALGRPMAVGPETASGSPGLSDDEHLLLGLVDGSVSRHGVDCPEDAVAPLECALCSTRIMLALTVGRQDAPTLQ